MPTASIFTLNLRHQQLAQDWGGHTVWQTVITPTAVPAARTGIIVCDMWDAHWSRGATERVNALAPRMNGVIRAARERGALIIHSPSDVLDFYADAPARLRAREAPQVAPPEPLVLPDPPLPVDASDHGSDTGETAPFKAWSRQHPAVEIDQERDIISADGPEVYSCLKHHGIEHLIMMGVHTNMCVLHRSFGIKAMVRWGLRIALARDLTDAMYNPAMPPYVSHWEGVRLVVEFIEKHWCPTISSDELVR